MPNNIAKGWEEILTDADLNDPSYMASGNLTVAPEEPVKIIRDDTTGAVNTVMYGNLARMLAGDQVVTWTEDIIRDATTGQVIGIQTTRPNGTMTMEHIIRDPITGKIDHTELEYL
jgi:hypothetical protein